MSISICDFVEQFYADGSVLEQGMVRSDDPDTCTYRISESNQERLWELERHLVSRIPKQFKDLIVGVHRQSDRVEIEFSISDGFIDWLKHGVDNYPDSAFVRVLTPGQLKLLQE